jgi:hypothetical protein
MLYTKVSCIIIRNLKALFSAKLDLFEYVNIFDVASKNELVIE